MKGPLPVKVPVRVERRPGVGVDLSVGEVEPAGRIDVEVTEAGPIEPAPEDQPAENQRSS